jgi:ectoine hydroxylase
MSAIDAPGADAHEWLANTMSAAEEADFNTAGYLLKENVLRPEVVTELESLADELHHRHLAAGGNPGEEFVCDDLLGKDPRFVDLADHPRTFPLVWGVLGWNIALYHTQLLLKPPSGKPPRRTTFSYHQDSGRLNTELETSPRPRVSIKVAFYLTDTTTQGRGNTWLIPGSQLSNEIRLPPDGNGQPHGAIPVLAPAGSALVFDRRIWHAGTRNWSDSPRKAVFYGYAFRWLRNKDDMAVDPAWINDSPVRKQLCGFGTPRSRFTPGDGEVPLRDWLARHGALRPDD